MYSYYNKMNIPHINKSNSKNKSKSKNIRKRTYKILKGGKYLGKGSFGCVVTPSLSCKNISNTSLEKQKQNYSLATNATNNNNNNNVKTISKIVLNDENTSIDDELYINNKLRKLDPKMKYFLTIIDHCRIKNVPTDRNNIIKVKYKNLKINNNINSSSNLFTYLFNRNTYKKKKSSISSNNRYNSSKYDILHSGIIPKEYCPVDIATDPINIIMPYGGSNINDIIISISNYFKNKSLQSQYKQSKSNTKTITKNQKNINNAHILYKNLKYYIRHLLIGLYTFHNNHIVHKDIKPDNIIIDVDTQNDKKNKAIKITKKNNNDNNDNKLNVRYIDFGFTLKLPTKIDTLNIMTENISGTYAYISIEIPIIYYIITNYENIKYNNDNNDNNNNAIILNNLFKNDLIKEHNSLLKELNLDTTNYKKTLTDIYNKNIKYIMYDKRSVILHKYYGIDTTDKYSGYLQKSDIYALGLTLYTFVTFYNKYYKLNKNTQLFDLLYKMIEIDTDKRYNVINCLRHPYIENK